MNLFPRELEEFRDQKQWVLYRLQNRKGKITKVPYNARTGKAASSTDPDTWSTYNDVRMAYDTRKYDGIGIVFANGLMGIDIDHCMNPATGELKDFAQDIINMCDTYTEISPSGSGIHCLCYGSKPATICKITKGESIIEMYDKGRYFTVTGNTLIHKPVNERTQAVKAIYEKYFDQPKPKTKPAAALPVFQYPNDKTDAELIDLAMNDVTDGGKFRALWEGDISDYANDHSRADQALVDRLARWTNGDRQRMDQLFRMSGLMRPKWDEKRGARGTYGDITLATALKSFRPQTEQTVKPVPFTEADLAMFGSDKYKKEITIGDPVEDPEPEEPKPDNIADYIANYFRDEIEAFRSGSDKKTGFSQLDAKACGIYSGLYVIGGISSVGKTTFSHQLADQIAAAGGEVLYFSLEQSRLEMTCKSISRSSAMIDKTRARSSLQIRNGYTDDLIERAMADYSGRVKDRLSIIEGNFKCTASYIKDYTERYILRNNTRPAVFIDYLQILQPEADPETKHKPTDPRLIADYNVTALKRMTRDLDIPVFIISSVNRSNYLTEIDFESFKESGGIEYTADVVWGLQLEAIHDPVFSKAQAINEKRDKIREAKAASPREIELSCLKNRYGISNYSVHFKYYPQYDLFEEKEDREQQSPGLNNITIY